MFECGFSVMGCCHLEVGQTTWFLCACGLCPSMFLLSFEHICLICFLLQAFLDEVFINTEQDSAHLKSRGRDKIPVLLDTILTDLKEFCSLTTESTRFEDSVSSKSIPLYRDYVYNVALPMLDHLFQRFGRDDFDRWAWLVWDFWILCYRYRECSPFPPPISDRKDAQTISLSIFFSLNAEEYFEKTFSFYYPLTHTHIYLCMSLFFFPPVALFFCKFLLYYIPNFAMVFCL